MLQMCSTRFDILRVPRRARHFSLPVLVVVAVVLGVTGCAKPPPPEETAVPVVVVPVQRRTLPEIVDAVGNVEAINTVAIKSRVDGQLLESHVGNGDTVDRGELLFKIDPRPAQAALAQVKAALARDVAARDLARAQVKRYEPVAKKGYISADQMQQYVTSLESARASVKVDQANVAAARLNLGYTDIYAPIDGRAGRVLVQPGNLIKANDTQALLTINQLSPIYVKFAVPGREVDRIRAAATKGTPAVQVYGDGVDGRIVGKLAFIDNVIDASTNTVSLRGIFENADHRLWPGEFVKVQLTLGEQANVLAVPDAAIKTGPNGTYVFVIKHDGRAQQRDVSVERSIKGESIIGKGLTEGEQVVIDGQSRLEGGTRVKIVHENGH